MLKSIRWRLPLTYAAIALLAALSLGAVLLTTLRGYYAQREVEHLENNALAISARVEHMQQQHFPVEQIEAQLQTLAFLAQTQIRVFDADQQDVIYEVKSPQDTLISLSYAPTLPIGDGMWATAIEEFDTRTVDALSGSPPQVQWMGIVEGSLAPQVFNMRSPDYTFMAVAQTPYGFGINAEFSPGRYSDQTARTPIYATDGAISGYIELSHGPAIGMEIIDSVASALIGAGAVAVILAALVGWWISRQISTPLLLLTEVTSRMAEGKLSARVSMNRSDEFGMLAIAYNEMASRVEDTVTTLRRFVADAAHELHTPLTALHADLELAATDQDDCQRIRFIERANAQVKRLEALTNGLLDLSRLESGAIQQERVTFDVVALAQELSEVYASRAEQANVQFQFDLPSKPVVLRANEPQIRRALCNLLDNAIKFTPENGTITVSVSQDDDDIELVVNDTGVGIPPEDLPHIFNRFHRGRNVASYPGNGLGLAIIKAIADGHQGRVQVESAPGSTRFALRLPGAA